MVHFYGLFLLLIVSNFGVNAFKLDLDNTIEDTELVFAFMVHRHGDRTPTGPSSLNLLKNILNQTELDTLNAPYGFGQLTDAGKRTGYKTGEFIRRRYNAIIGPKYNRSEIYIRSTDSTRTKLTLLTALSAVFPASKNNWNDKINWDPVPYTTVPLEDDFNLFFVNCPKFLDYVRNLKKNSPILEIYTDLFNRASQAIQHEFSNFVDAAFFYDVLLSLDSLGYHIPANVRKLMPDLNDAAADAWTIILGNEEYLPLQAGPLLTEFFKYANELIAGRPTSKVRIYAGHDMNVFSLKEITKAKPRTGIAKYGSLYSLELRRLKSGKYVVLPVYLSDPHEGVEKYLEVEGCGGLLCDYDTFYNITSGYLLDESEWRTCCGPVKDINASSVY